MQIIINDINNITILDLAVLNMVTLHAQGKQPQPEVGQNTGTVGSVSPMAVSSAEANSVSESAEGNAAPHAEPSAAPEKPKRTRVKKEEVAVAQPGESDGSTDTETSTSLQADPNTSAPSADLSTEASSAPVSADPEDKTYTIDDVRAALQLYTGKHGMPKAIDLLKAYKAGRISEVKPEDYASFVKDCNE